MGASRPGQGAKVRPPPRAVLDTNVVLSALIFGTGKLAPLRQAWQTARCRPLVSRATTGELARALAYPKFCLNEAAQREMLGDYLPYCEAIVIPAKPPKIPPCRDPFDVPFLQLAVAGKAEFLVTGDRDLLSVGGRLPFSPITAAEFLRILPTR